MPLSAEPSVQKVLLSSPARVVGEYRTPGFIVMHAWPHSRSRDSYFRRDEGPLSRNAFVFAFEAAQPEPAPGVVIPDYSGGAEMIASYLCLLYGKRFDSHGLFESNGYFQVPDLSEYSQPSWPWLPHNSHAERPDLGVTLNLRECARLLPVLTGAAPREPALAFQAGCRFYMRALQACERDPEVAFLHLVTVGELLAAQQRYEKSDLLDADGVALLTAIRGLPNGDSLARRVQARMLQIKRGFVRALTELVDDDFFQTREARDEYEALKRETYQATLAAAYDLRSKYVHVGMPFGVWVSSTSPMRLAEVHVGRPVVDDEEFAKLLQQAPTLLGLERIVRYCLFRFGENAGVLAPGDPSIVHSDP